MKTLSDLLNKLINVKNKVSSTDIPITINGKEIKSIDICYTSDSKINIIIKEK